MTFNKLLLTSSLTALLLWSCDVKDPIYETAHPNHGKITLTTDWTNRTSGIDVPASYTVKVGDYSTSLSGSTNTVNNLFAPGNYALYVYNTADNIAVSGTTATANYPAGALGWLFTSATDIAIAADTDHTFTAAMQQQVRQLTLVIEPAGGTASQVAAITATLSGVAGSYDMAGGTHGAATTVSLTFIKSDATVYPAKWTATVRLLGVTGAEQKLAGTISFTGGSPSAMVLESNLTSELANFNNDKATPLALGGTAVDTPTATGFTATITNWTSVSGGSVVAN